MDLPRIWNGTIEVDGAVWFRKQITIPAKLAGKDLDLALGTIKDFDVTYFNGVKVGATGGEGKQTYMIPRVYRIPAELAKEGPAVIAVRVFDERGGGGFAGDGGYWNDDRTMTLTIAGSPPVSTTAPADQQPMFLRGGWKYKIERPLDPNDLKPFPAGMPYPPFLKADQPNLTPGGIYNAMIHPLLAFGFRGAAWYQGESNADRGEQYRTLLPAMITDWRHGAGATSRSWSCSFPPTATAPAGPRSARPRPSPPSDCPRSAWP